MSLLIVLVGAISAPRLANRELPDVDAPIVSVTTVYKGAAAVTRFTDTREVVGVSVRQILTDFCTLNLVYEPDSVASELFLFRPEMCRVVGMPIPSKGLLFAEPLSQAKASELWQVYGELGIDYRHEIWHGVIRNYT